MQRNVRALTTYFAGVAYRSRLEARWAAFFGRLRIEYRYEPQGYAVTSGWYLPDFYLPGCNRYVEVKPTEDVPPDCLTRIKDFAREVGHICLLTAAPYDYIAKGWDVHFYDMDAWEFVDGYESWSHKSLFGKGVDEAARYTASYRFEDNPKNRIVNLLAGLSDEDAERLLVRLKEELDNDKAERKPKSAHAARAR